jgi:hypothetical protein
LFISSLKMQKVKNWKISLNLCDKPPQIQGWVSTAPWWTSSCSFGMSLHGSRARIGLHGSRWASIVPRLNLRSSRQASTTRGGEFPQLSGWGFTASWWASMLWVWTSAARRMSLYDSRLNLHRSREPLHTTLWRASTATKGEPPLCDGWGSKAPGWTCTSPVWASMAPGCISPAPGWAPRLQEGEPLHSVYSQWAWVGL